jgi:DNA primase
MPGIDYRQLRQQITIARVLDLIGFQPGWQHRSQLRGPCPIPGCRSSIRSFSVQLTGQIYHCFACHSHGNALDLWAAVRGLSLHQAAVDLCRVTNLDLPRLPASRFIPTTGQPPRVPFRASLGNR